MGVPVSVELGWLVVNQPQEARRRIEELLVRHKDNAVAAARECRVDYRTFGRWLKKLSVAGAPVRRGRGRPRNRRGKPPAGVRGDKPRPAV